MRGVLAAVVVAGGLLLTAGPAAAYECSGSTCTCVATDEMDCMNMATHCKPGSVSSDPADGKNGKMSCTLEDALPIQPVPTPAPGSQIAVAPPRSGLALYALIVGGLGLLLSIIALVTRRAPAPRS